MPACLALPPQFPERFAIEWGHDEYGIFQSFAVDRVVQRMRWIPPGLFVMGSPKDEMGRYDDEIQHRVELTQGIWLGNTPVTQALWEAVMGSNPSKFKGEARPVETVSWDDCQEFITRLNGRVPGLDARLPTEAEWEYACRAGTTTTTWVGDLRQSQEIDAPQLHSIAWYRANAERSTQRVAQKAANPWGLYDMLGNVYEWCVDWSDTYDIEMEHDPRGPADGPGRVVRGGSWYVDARYIRAAIRNIHRPACRCDNVGFRLARSPALSPASRTTTRRVSPVR